MARDLFDRFFDHEISEVQGEEIDPTSSQIENELISLGSYDSRLRGTLEPTVEGVIPQLMLSLMGTEVSNSGAVLSVSVGGATTYMHSYIPNQTMNAYSRFSWEERLGNLQESALNVGRGGNAICMRQRFDFSNPAFSRWEYEALAGNVQRLSGTNATTGITGSPTLPAQGTMLSRYMYRLGFGGRNATTCGIVVNTSTFTTGDLTVSFSSGDVGAMINMVNANVTTPSPLMPGTYIASVTNATTVLLSENALATVATKRAIVNQQRATVRSGWVEVRRNNFEDDFTIDNRQRRDAEYGPITGAFEFEVAMTDMDDLRRFWGSATATTPGSTPALYALSVAGRHPTPIGTNVGSTAGYYALGIDMPGVFLQSVSAPLRGKEYVVQRIAGVPLYDSNFTFGQRVTLMNTVQSSYDVN